MGLANERVSVLENAMQLSILVGPLFVLRIVEIQISTHTVYHDFGQELKNTLSDSSRYCGP